MLRSTPARGRRFVIGIIGISLIGCAGGGSGGGGGNGQAADPTQGDDPGETLAAEVGAETTTGAVGGTAGSAVVGAAVNLTATAGGGTPPYGYDWWVQDGPNGSDDPAITDSEAISASVTFTEPGIYSIGLIVNDDTRAEIEQFYEIEVVAAPPNNEEPPEATGALADVRFWAYQIQRLEDDRSIDMIDELVESRYDLLVLEPTRSDRDSTDFDTAGMVRRLHDSPGSTDDRNKLVVAYIDIGQAEDWRTYWEADWVAPTETARGTPDFLITIDPDGWSGNYPVAYWDDRWKDLMIYNDDSVLQQVLDDGFDGIYMDWVEAYSDLTVMAAADEGMDLAAEMIQFIHEIRDYAREQNPDFLIIPQNSAEILEFDRDGYLDLIDAIALEQIYYDGDADTDWNEPAAGDTPIQDTCPEDDEECGYSREFYEGWADEYLAAGIPVLCVDYAADPANAADAYDRAAANGYIPYVSRRPLDRLTETPPPGLPD